MPHHIVVADDSLFARMLIKEAVSKIFDDATFKEFASGQEVLDAQGNGDQFDYWLLDVNMGEPNGYETAKGLIENGADVQQISLITGNKSKDLQEKADEINLNYVNKAIGPADVEKFVGRLRTFFRASEGE